MFLLKNRLSIHRITILWMLFSFTGKAQILFNKRIKTFNGAGGVLSVLLSGNDFILLGSESYKYGTIYNERYLVLKLDSVGDTLHTKSYGKMKYNYYSSYWGGACALNNKLYDVGTRTDSLNHYKKMFYKFNTNGDTVFTKFFNDTSGNYGASTKITRNQKLILFGSSDSLDPNYDYSLLLTDTFGNIKFEKHYGTSNPENPSAIDTCKDGGFILGGWRQLPGTNNYTTYVVKTDSLGSMQWQNTYGNYAGQNIFTCKKGGYIITADYKDSVVGAEVFLRPNLIKINNNGVVVWDKKYLSSTYGENAIISRELVNGDIITCGTVGHVNNPPVSGYNYGIYGFIMKTDSSGNLKFYQTYQATTFQGAQNYLRDIKLLPDGGVVAVGFVQPYDGTSQDVWVLRVDSNGCEVPGCSLNNAIQSYLKNQIILNVYPNPFKDELNITIGLPDNSSKGKLQLIEPETGRILFERIVNTTRENYSLNTSELSSGMYLIRVKGENIQPQHIKVISAK